MATVRHLVQGHLRSSTLVSIRKPIMQLPISHLVVTFVVSLTVCEILTHNARNNLFSPPYPCLTPPLGGIPSEFLDETYPVKTRGMGLLYSEHCMILISTVFD